MAFAGAGASYTTDTRQARWPEVGEGWGGSSIYCLRARVPAEPPGPAPPLLCRLQRSPRFIHPGVCDARRMWLATFWGVLTGRAKRRRFHLCIRRRNALEQHGPTALLLQKPANTPFVSHTQAPRVTYARRAGEEPLPQPPTTSVLVDGWLSAATGYKVQGCIKRRAALQRGADGEAGGVLSGVSVVQQTSAEKAAAWPGSNRVC